MQRIANRPCRTVLEGTASPDSWRRSSTSWLTRFQNSSPRPVAGAYRKQTTFGSVAVIRVGGATEVEVKEKKDRVDDALNATRAAVEEGISPGGGVALLRAIPALDAIKVENSDQKTGVDIVRKAIQAPARQIVDNAGDDGAVVVGKLLEAKEYNYGYD